MPRRRPVQFVPAKGVNLSTGEYGAFLAETPVKGRRGADPREKEPHVRHYDAGMIELARLPLQGNDRRVLTALTALMTYEGPFRFSTNQIAEALDMLPQGVSRSVRNLKENGVLLELDFGEVMIHPKYFWKGDAKLRQDWLEKIEGEAKHGGH